MNNWNIRSNWHPKQDNIYNNIFIPAKYRDAIIKHVLLNYAGNVNGFQPPLYLAIQGVRGEGKTFMLRRLCEFYNIDYVFISGSRLCGQNEGDSIKYIKKEYESACIETLSSKRMHLIVIDDFHLSIAANFDKNVSRTTNAQVLVSYLMNLADEPFIRGVRVPVIFIGNDFTNIYSALIRDGRTNFFKWEPELEDKIKMVYYMFKKFYPSVSENDIDNLVRKYNDRYMAFFQGVLEQLCFDGFSGVIAEFHSKKGKISIPEVNKLIADKLIVNEKINYQLLLKFARIQSERKEEKFD